MNIIIYIYPLNAVLTIVITCYGPKRRKFDRVAELQSQKVSTGGVAVLKDSNRFIYYLVTKDRSTEKPKYPNLAKSLAAMRDHMVSCLVYT